MKKLLYLLLITCLLSCSAQRRVSRIVHNHPELSISDTIKYSHLVIRPFRNALLNMPDSILRTMQPGDSVISVSKKGVTIIVRKKQQSTEIEASVPSDTVSIDTSFVAPKIVVTENNKVKLQKLRIIHVVVIIILILVIYAIIRKIIGK